MKRIITNKKSFFLLLSEIIDKKELLVLLIKRDIYLRYKYKTLGLFWGVIQPLLLATIISQSLGKIAPHILGAPYYFFSVFLGYLFWMYFSSTITKANSSILSARTLIKNTAFPHIILPISTLAVGFIDLITSLIVAILFAFFLGIHIYFFPLLFLCILIMILTTIGVATLFAALNARFTDLREIIGFSITILFYLTPIIYPVRLIPIQYHTYLYINPMVGVIETAKAAILNPSAIRFDGLMISFFSSIIIMLFGILIFEKIDKNIVDIL